MSSPNGHSCKSYPHDVMHERMTPIATKWLSLRLSQNGERRETMRISMVLYDAMGVVQDTPQLRCTHHKGHQPTTSPSRLGTFPRARSQGNTPGPPPGHHRMAANCPVGHKCPLRQFALSQTMMRPTHPAPFSQLAVMARSRPKQGGPVMGPPGLTKL